MDAAGAFASCTCPALPLRLPVQPGIRLAVLLRLLVLQSMQARSPRNLLCIVAFNGACHLYADKAPPQLNFAS